MFSNIKTIETTFPSEADAALAEQSSRALAAHISSRRNPAIVIKEGKKQVEIQVEIPAQALRLLVDILIQMGEGNAVTLVPIHVELSTQEGADLLNVSRPYFVSLLEEGKIPFRKVGTKRRIMAKDVLAYKVKEDEARFKVLAELTEQAQKLKMGYDD
ncbi:MAG: excisionase family DNA-binding protein [Candidatus Berkiellales bacterium]